MMLPRSHALRQTDPTQRNPSFVTEDDGYTYKSSGVDRDAAEQVKLGSKTIATPTHGTQVLGGIGGFGAAYQLSGYREPVLISSTDGVGTKLKIAIELGKYDGLGKDLVNACINDVIVSGAKPLFFLDYIAMGKLSVNVAESLVRGMADACEAAGCALIGGETAEMPGLYAENDFDLAGFVVGVVEKSDMLDGSSIRTGDLLVGIPSNGLHTNGYSLVRSVLGLDSDPSPLGKFHPELGRTLGDALLEPHLSYYPMVGPLFNMIKGIAHITGGGLVENVPRVMPDELATRFDTSAWPIPPIFTLIQEIGEVSRDEMYRVFNMGLGMVLICDRPKADQIVSSVDEAMVVGEVSPRKGKQRVML